MSEPRVFPALTLIEYLDMPPQMAGELLGLSRNTVSGWKVRSRCFDAYEADSLASRLKMHPAEIWSNWWTEQ